MVEVVRSDMEVPAFATELIRSELKNGPGEMSVFPTEPIIQVGKGNIRLLACRVRHRAEHFQVLYLLKRCSAAESVPKN